MEKLRPLTTDELATLREGSAVVGSLPPALLEEVRKTVISISGTDSPAEPSDLNGVVTKAGETTHVTFYCKTEEGAQHPFTFVLLPRDVAAFKLRVVQE